MSNCGVLKYTHIGANNAGNIFQLGIWGFNHITAAASGYTGIATTTPAYTLDVAGDVNTSANHREAGIALSTKYALSNSGAAFSNYVTPIVLYSSNALSNLSTTASIAAFSNYVSPMAVYSSNALSNYQPLTAASAFSNASYSNVLALSNATASNLTLSSNATWSNLNTLSNYSHALQASAAGWTAGSSVYTLSNVAIGKSNASYALDVNGTVNATAFLGNVPWSNVTGAPPLVVSSGSNSSGFSLGNTILQGMLGGVVGSATQYALSVAGTSLFDTLGNVAPGLTSQLNSWASSLLTAGTQAISAPEVTTPLLASGTGQITSSASISAPYFRSGLTSVIIDGSNNLIFTGLSASNLGCTMGQNFLASSNAPLLLQTVNTGSNPVTGLTLSSSNATIAGILATPQLLLAGSNVLALFGPSNALLAVSGVASWGSNASSYASNQIPTSVGALSNLVYPIVVWSSNQLPSYQTLAAFQSYSNATNVALLFGSNTASYSSNALSNYETITAYSSNYIWSSNSLSNYETLVAFNAYSNATQSNIISLSNYAYSQSNSTSTIYTSGINATTASIAGGAIGLSALGLAFSGTTFFNQNGQLASAITDVATSGTSLSIDPTAGTVSALTGKFKYAKFGNTSITLSNDLMIFTTGSNSNAAYSSNSVSVLNGQPYTISACNLVATGAFSAPSASFAALSMAVPSYTTIPVTSSGMGSTSFINVGIGQSTTTSNCGVLKYTHIGSNSSSNIFQFGLWGLNPLTAAGSGYFGVGTASPGYLLDVAGDVNATNHREAGVALSTKYALSNSGAAFSNWVSPIANAALPTTTYTAFSNYVSPIAVYGSNTLATFSNYVSPIAVYSSNASPTRHLIIHSEFQQLRVTHSGLQQQRALQLWHHIVLCEFQQLHYSPGDYLLRVWYTQATNTVYTPCNVLSAGTLTGTGLTLTVPSYTTIPVTSSGMGSTSFMNVGIGQSTTTSNCGVIKYTHIGANNAGNMFQLGIWGFNHVTVLASGYTGIATTTPAYTLDVAGTTRTTSFIASNVSTSNLTVAASGTISGSLSAGPCTFSGAINNLNIGSFGLGGGSVAIAHTSNSSLYSYALAQDTTGNTTVNCSSSGTVKICNNNTSIAQFSSNYITTSVGIQSTNTLEVASPSGFSYMFNIATSQNLILWDCPTAGSSVGAADVFEIQRANGNRLLFYGNGMYLPYATTLTQSYGYLNSGGTTGTSSGTTGYSIQALYRISASEFDAVSDRRLKDEISPFADDLCSSLVDKVNTRHFKMKRDGRYKIGFIAQEVEEIIPNAVTVTPHDELKDCRTLDNAQMLAVLWGAVRQLQTSVHELQSQLKSSPR